MTIADELKADLDAALITIRAVALLYGMSDPAEAPEGESQE